MQYNPTGIAGKIAEALNGAPEGAEAGPVAAPRTPTARRASLSLIVAAGWPSIATRVARELQSSRR